MNHGEGVKREEGRSNHMAFDEPSSLRNAGFWRAAIHEYRWRRRIRESPRTARDRVESIERYKALHLSCVKTVKEFNERRRWRRRPDVSCDASSSAIVVRDEETEEEGEEDSAEFYRMLVTIHDEVERWAVGKHGNLLALLSTLQNVLWAAEADVWQWEPVSMDDMKKVAEIKIAFRKAVLCVDQLEVSIKGGKLPELYRAAKAFLLLKEAWDEFWR